MVSRFWRIHTVILCWAVLGLAASGLSQVPGVKTPAPAPDSQTPAADDLHRSTPRDSVYAFLQACQSGNYLRASDYLDLRRLPANDRRRQGMELALQLEEVLNRDPYFNVQRLSESAEGTPRDLPDRNLELVNTFDVKGKMVNVELERIQVKPGLWAWLFSSDTVAAIPSLGTLLGESEFEKNLPDVLVKTTFMDTALWRWIVLIVLVPALGFLGRIVSHVALLLLRRVFRISKEKLAAYSANELVGPTGLLLGVAAYGAGVAFVGPSALVRFYLSRLLTLLAFMAIAWIVMGLLDILSRRLHFTADPRQQALYSSILPLGLRVAKITVFVIALIATFSTWGYNTSTIWATLGVGSLAVALAAQKTLENFFGGISVIGDRPVLVGDFCRVGSMVGTVEDIGLRSTKIRTLDRTLVTVPNSQFSTMTLENFAPRDKMWFHPTFGLRCDASPDQIRTVMASFEKILKDHPEVEIGGVPLRFTGIGDYTYNIEVFAYVLTPSFDRFLMVQTELLLKMLDAVEQAGTGLAVPLRELTGSARVIGEGTSAAPAIAAPERDGRANSHG
jgi:MscS family membrane protein